MYTVRMLKAASRELARLDRSAAQRIVKRIRWLAKKVEKARLETLKGNLAGFYKLREGDYRIIYELIRTEEVLIIHSIGHRRDVYQRK